MLKNYIAAKLRRKPIKEIDKKSILFHLLCKVNIFFKKSLAKNIKYDIINLKIGNLSKKGRKRK